MEIASRHHRSKLRMGPVAWLISALSLACGAGCASLSEGMAELEKSHPLPEDMPFSLHYLGTACFVIGFRDRVICLDPGDFLTRRLSRTQARALTPCDLILVSHADFDHCNRLAMVPQKPGCVIMGTESLQRSFPTLGVLTSSHYESDWIKVETLPVKHALRAKVDHVGYKILLGGKTLLFMGDGHGPLASLPREPDFLFVTIGGLSANPRSAADLARALEARHVLPMHWERLFRGHSRVLRFRRLLADDSHRLVFLSPGKMLP